MATSFQPLDGRLWVLDEIPASSDLPARVQLLRITPSTGAMQRVGVWTDAGRYGHHWLVADRDSSVLLVASGAPSATYRVVRLHANSDGVTPAGASSAEPPLALKPVVDGEGYWLVTQVDTNHAARLGRLSALRLVAATWDDVAACF